MGLDLSHGQCWRRVARPLQYQAFVGNHGKQRRLCVWPASLLHAVPAVVTQTEAGAMDSLPPVGYWG